MRHATLPVLCTLCFCSTGALANSLSPDRPLPVTIDLNILASAQYNMVRDGALNQDNLLQRPDMRFETAAVIEGRAFDVRYRLRAPYTAEHSASPAPNGWQTHSGLRLQELARDFDLGHDTTLTLGKTLLQWDTGYAFHPVGFFDRKVNLSDSDDRLRYAEGQPLIALGHIGNGWDTMAVIARKSGNSRDQNQQSPTQWAWKVGAQVDAASLTAILQQPDGERIGIGGTGTYTLGNTLELHGSVFTRKGTRHPIHKALLTGDIRDYTADEEVVGAFRRKDNRWYPRWVIGGQWTSDSLVNIIVEWVHDSQGLDTKQWSGFKDLIRHHKQGGTCLSSAALAGNLRHDAKLFSTDRTRQDYVFVRLVKGGRVWEPSLATLVGLADASASFNARLSYMGAKNWQAWIDARVNIGPPGSEYRLVPEAGFFGIAFRFVF